MLSMHQKCNYAHKHAMDWILVPVSPPRSAFHSAFSLRAADLVSVVVVCAGHRSGWSRKCI